MRVLLVMVLSIFSLQVLLRLDFRWDSDALAWSRPGLPQLSNLAGLFSISRLLFLMFGVIRLQLTFVAGRGFRGGPLLDIHGSLQLLSSSHVRERDKALLRGVMFWGYLEWVSPW